MDKTRFSHLISSNDAPATYEAIELENTRDELTASLNRLMLQDPHQLDLGVQSVIRKLDCRLSDLRAVLSPQRKVPLELIAQFISTSLPETSNSQGRAKLIQACLVCKSWRVAALSKHRLWTNLELELGSLPYENVALWFGRSGSLPKSLRVTKGSSLRATLTSTQSLGKLLRCGPRLDTLHLSMHNTSEWVSILRSIDRSTPPSRAWNSLRSLGLSFSSGRWDDPPFRQLPPVQAFQLRLPWMEHAFTSVESCVRTRLDFRPEFLQNLTHFQIHFNWPPDPIAPILERCVNLETLRIDFESTPLLFFEEWPVFNFPRLRSLHLESITSIESLDFIRAPILRHLHLDFHISSYCDQIYLDSSEVKEVWPAFVHRHRRITSLCIQDVIIDTTAFRAMFSPSSPLPELSRLTLDRVCWDRKIARADSWRRLFSPRVLHRYTRVFPCLESVNLLRVDGDFIELDALLDFVEEQESGSLETSGQAPEHPNPRPGIKSFTLTYHQKDGPDSIPIGHRPETLARIDAQNRGGTRVNVGPRFKN